MGLFGLSGIVEPESLGFRYNIAMKKLSKQGVIGLTVFVLGLLFIVLGLLQGDYAEILRKAILICYECIGIG